jgi:hypothetical protein
VRIRLPKRWSRAKRQRVRVICQRQRDIFVSAWQWKFKVAPALKDCLDKVWVDEMKPFDWRSALNPHPGAQSRFLDDEGDE